MAHQLVFGKVAPCIAWLALIGCGGSGDDGADDGGTDQSSSASGTTGGGGAAGNGSASNGSDANTSSAEPNNSATTSGQTNGTSTTGANSGAGGAATSGANTSGTDSSSSGASCEEVSCLRPYECATSCDAEPSYVGCCPCAEGEIDQFTDCTEGGGDCGGASCDAGEYCEKPVGECDAGNDAGSCAPMPGGCSLEYAPVCGCDGMTYGNSCGAASAGVNVASTGECE